MKSRSVYLFILRYFLLLVLASFNLYIIYALVSPLTIYSSFFLISHLISNQATIAGNSIFINGFKIELVEACIAGSAYYLLLILNLTTPMRSLVRAKTLVFTIALFFIFNVARISIFTMLFISGFQYFDITHKLVWYAGSIILVILLWFSAVLLFKIDKIPVYSDIRNILSISNNKRKKI